MNEYDRYSSYATEPLALTLCLEEGSILLSEAVCDWLKGAKEPLYIARNGAEDSGIVRCGCEKLVMKDNDFDELEFLEIREIPDTREEISVDAVSFCRGLRACAQHADPSTLSSQGLVLESGTAQSISRPSPQTAP